MPSHLQNYIVFWYFWLPPITLLFCHYSFWPSVSISFVAENSLACPHRRNFFTWNPLDGFCLEPSVKGSSQNPIGSTRIPYIQTPCLGLHPVRPVPSYKASYNAYKGYNQETFHISSVLSRTNTEFLQEPFNILVFSCIIFFSCVLPHTTLS